MIRQPASSCQESIAPVRPIGLGRCDATRLFLGHSGNANRNLKYEMKKKLSLALLSPLYTSGLAKSRLHDVRRAANSGLP